MLCMLVAVSYEHIFDINHLKQVNDINGHEHVYFKPEVIAAFNSTGDHLFLYQVIYFFIRKTQLSLQDCSRMFSQAWWCR